MLANVLAAHYLHCSYGEYAKKMAQLRMSIGISYRRIYKDVFKRLHVGGHLMCKGCLLPRLSCCLQRAVLRVMVGGVILILLLRLLMKLYS